MDAQPACGVGTVCARWDTLATATQQPSLPPTVVQAAQASLPQSVLLQANVPVKCVSSRASSLGPQPAPRRGRGRDGRGRRTLVPRCPCQPQASWHLHAGPPRPHPGGERLPACVSWEQPHLPLPAVLPAFTYLGPKNRVTPGMADSVCPLAWPQCPGICSSTV